MENNKYYQIMELECNTKINNRSVGADFYYCKESEKDSIIAEIEARENNYDINEITESDYYYEQNIIQRKNFRLATGY